MIRDRSPFESLRVTVSVPPFDAAQGDLELVERSNH
jgi:hypothetical protein